MGNAGCCPNQTNAGYDPANGLGSEAHGAKLILHFPQSVLLPLECARHIVSEHRCKLGVILHALNHLTRNKMIPLDKVSASCQYFSLTNSKRKWIFAGFESGSAR